MDDELYAHRTRTNRRPEPAPLQLEQAVNQVFEDIVEDRH